MRVPDGMLGALIGRCVVIALALGCLGAPAAETGVVFVVQPATGEDGEPAAGLYTIEPLGYLGGGRLSRVPDSVDVRAFARRYYVPSGSYAVYAGGRVAGRIRPLGGPADPCGNLLVPGKPVGDYKPGVSGKGLASSLPLRETSLTAKEPDAEAQAFVMRQIGRIFARHGVPAAQPATDRPDRLTVWEGAGQRLLVATFSVPMKRRVDGAEATGLHAGFLIAESTAQGAYRLAKSWFHSGLEADVVRPVLVDVADLDGDGIPEIVMQNYYYEDYDFRVWHRQGNTWGDVFHSPGANCM